MTDHTSDKNRTPSLFKKECTFVQENIEAEALDILEPADHARVQRHLELCGPCRRALAEMRRVTGLLPLLSEPATPSPEVKAHLFERIEEEREPGPRLVSSGNPWVPVEHPAPDAGAPAPANGPTGWRGWLMSALVAPMAIGLIVLGAWTNSLLNDLESARSGEGDTVAQIAAGSGDMRLYAMESSCPDCDDTPATGHLGGNPDDNVGILVAWNLNPNEQHEVWCEDRDGKVIRISDLNVEQTGQVFQTLSFPDAIGGYSTIYVTRNDGTEEMRVAMHEDTAPADSTPAGDDTGGE